MFSSVNKHITVLFGGKNLKLENVIEPKQVSGFTKRFIASLIIFLYLTPSLQASEFQFDVCHWGVA